MSGSTAPAVSVSASSEPVQAAAPAPKPKRVLRVAAILRPRAAKWKPVSVVAGATAGGCLALIRLVKKRKVVSGRSLASSCAAAVHPRGDDRQLIVSVFPKRWEETGRHFELRFLVIEGYLESAGIFDVSPRRPSPERLDSYELRRRGLDFTEQSPASGRIRLAALEPKAGAASVNAGQADADFGVDGLGRVRLGFFSRGLTFSK